MVARRLAPLIPAKTTFCGDVYKFINVSQIGTALQRRKAPCYDHNRFANLQFA